jgi:hypothetical protein
VDELRHTLGTTLSGEELRSQLSEILQLSPDDLCYVRLSGLVEWAPKKYHELTQWYTLGTRIGIDVHGRRSTPTGSAEVPALRSFRSTITHFNRAFTLSDRLNREPGPDGHELPALDLKKRHIDRDSSVAAALTSAYFTMEAYLNALSHDYLLKTPFEDIAPKHLVQLREWDDEKNQFRPLSLEKKLIRYPKIIVGSTHSPLENSNPWMRVVLDAKEIRDAFVHPSRHPDPSSFEPKKEMLAYDLDLERVTEVVDAVVELIFAVESAVHGSDDRLGWLGRRGRDGLFPDDLFE